MYKYGWYLVRINAELFPKKIFSPFIERRTRVDALSRRFLYRKSLENRTVELYLIFMITVTCTGTNTAKRHRTFRRYYNSYNIYSICLVWFKRNILIELNRFGFQRAKLTKHTRTRRRRRR